MSVNIDKLLAVLRARGCDPRDLRDGAHEAHHAIYVNLRKPWTRDRIHEALLKLARRSRIESIGLGFNELLVKYELEARAVEWIVCDRAGVEYDVEHWAHTMWMETMRNMNILLPTDDQVANSIKLAKQRPSLARAAERVIMLAEEPIRQPARRRTA